MNIGLFWVNLDGVELTLTPNTPVWGEKPVLNYFLNTGTISRSLLQDQILTPPELAEVKAVADVENQAVSHLFAQSRFIVDDPRLTYQKKIQRIREMGFNRQLNAILESSDRSLRARLDPKSYRSFIRWVEARWSIERYLHGRVRWKSGERSARVYATRFDSNGAYIVALPDKCLKFSNAGNHVCDDDGYVINQNYSVILSYTKSAGATVLDSGPWNIDDNYWSSLADPQPRRKFADLAVGMPEAQAAYYNGYNGGVDQFGRKVTGPYGIDLARQVSIDIGLEPGKNDWITVSFMWTGDWGKGGSSGSSPSGSSSAAPATKMVVNAIQVATPNEDGSVIHVVESGQTLWTIAAAYQVTLTQIYQLNNLTKDSVIIPGQKITIKAASGTPTGEAATPALTETPATPTITDTPKPTVTRAPLEIVTQTPLSGTTEVPASRESGAVGINILFAGILVLIGVGIGLVISGTVFKQRK